MQAVIDPESAFRIISLAANGSPDEMMTHVSGRTAAPVNTEFPAAPLEEAQARCTKPTDVEALAAGLEGIEFGPSFQWIDALWTGQRESLARLRQPEAVGNTEGYWLHPGLLDACLQAAGATLHAESGAEVLLPFSVKSLDVSGTAAGTGWWCHAKQVAESVWDIRLFDASGLAIAEIQGFEMRKASGEAFVNRRIADWMYCVEWQRQPLQVQAAPAGDAGWLIVDKGSGLGDELAQRLRRRGQRAALAVEDGEVRQLLAAPSQGVVYLCGAR
jgi:hypothetical protein